MGYSRDVYESANKTLELLRQSAVLDAENRKTAFYLRRRLKSCCRQQLWEQQKLF